MALFSGHMIDAPGREVPRFPADKELAAAEAISEALDEIGASAGDLCICGGRLWRGFRCSPRRRWRAQGGSELYIPFE